jgi:polyhydroxybutyrate depolymerase
VECSPIQPVSVLNIHGDSDESIPVEGGQRSQSFARIDFHSLEHTVSVWSAINGCHPEPVIVDAGVLLTSIWEGRAEGGTLQTILIHDASHAWAGGAARRRKGSLRPQLSDDLDASSVVWDFLRERTR